MIPTSNPHPLKSEIKKAEDALAGLGNIGEKEKIEKAKGYFNLAVGIAEIFRNGTFDEKNEALMDVCSNLTINGKTTTISERKELEVIKIFLLAVKKEYEDFEPKNFVNFTNKTSDFSPVLPNQITKLRCQDSNLEPTP